MTTDEALKELRELCDDPGLALIPNELAHPNGETEYIWQVIDVFAMATVIFDGGWEEAVLGQGSTPQEAIQKAKEAF